MSAKKDIYVHAPSLKKVKEEDIAIRVDHVTKDYGKGRGIFDVSFIVPKGKTFGYCGTNGAGKTTTLRHMMGFLHPDQGSVSVLGMDAWKEAEAIKPHVGYLPGEIAFPPLSTGSDFLKLQAEMIGLKDMSKAEELINILQLDPTANLKRMSKGMKQKTAMVACFMASPEILILDEPTTGLDPLMREAFMELIGREKARGATIIMSNHMFDELETTCDYVGFIKDGHLIDIVDMELIRNRPTRTYAINFATKEGYKKADRRNVKVLEDYPDQLTLIVQIDITKTDSMIRDLVKQGILAIHEVPYTLETYFQEILAGGKK